MMLCIPSMRNVKIDCLVIEGQRRPTQSKAFDKMLLDYLVEPVNPFNPEFTIVIFIHYKPRIAVAILDL